MNSGTDDIRNFAEGLWQYFLPKIEQKNADSVRYYRAQVTANNGDGTLTIQRPYDNAITVPCVESMKNAAVGSQVTVLVFGGTAIKNSVVVADGKFSAIGGGGGSSIDLPVSVANGGTGATTASDARDNLGLGALATKDSVKANEISGVFSISQGGTGASDASSARAALGATPYTDASTLISSGSIGASATVTYTATQDCVYYLAPQLQASYQSKCILTLNGVEIINLTTSALSLNVLAVPIMLMAGDTLKVQMLSNYTSSYKVFSVR